MIDRKQYHREYYQKHRKENVGFATKQQAKQYLNTLLLDNPGGLPFPTIMEHLQTKESRVKLYRHRISNWLGRDPELYKHNNRWYHIHSHHRNITTKEDGEVVV